MLRRLLLTLTLLLLTTGSASATTFSFDCITGNGKSKKCGVGEAQLSVEVTSDDGQVAFTLRNDGDQKLSAANLYFDDDAEVLARIVSVSGSIGVDFEEGGSPQNLPNGKKKGFEANSMASAHKPAPKMGVNPGEEVTVTFELADGKTFDDVLEALAESDLQIGVKTVAVGKSYINNPQGLPEPGTLGLFALAAGALALARPRR